MSSLSVKLTSCFLQTGLPFSKKNYWSILKNEDVFYPIRGYEKWEDQQTVDQTS